MSAKQRRKFISSYSWNDSLVTTLERGSFEMVTFHCWGRGGEAEMLIYANILHSETHLIDFTSKNQ